MITQDQTERLKEGLDSHSTTYLNGDDGALDLQDAYEVIDQWAKEENEREAASCSSCKWSDHGLCDHVEECSEKDCWEPKQ
jgi:hypothetical protein